MVLIKTYLLIIRTFKKNVYKDQDSIAIYKAHYSRSFFMELMLIYYRFFRFLLICFNILLNSLFVVRMPSLVRRSQPHLEFLYQKLRRKCIYSINRFIFLMKNGIYADYDAYIDGLAGDDEINLSNLPSAVLISICSFLPVNSIVNLASVNKRLNLKCESEILWKMIYETIYEKKMKEELPENQFKMFDASKYDNYKQACSEAHTVISKYKNLNPKKVRDKIIGLYRIVEEETLETCIRIPNLILYPWKMMGIVFTLAYFEIKKGKGLLLGTEFGKRFAYVKGDVLLNYDKMIKRNYRNFYNVHYNVVVVKLFFIENTLLLVVNLVWAIKDYLIHKTRRKDK